MVDEGFDEPDPVREGPGGSSGVPPRRHVRRRLSGVGLAGRRYLLAIAMLVALATVPTLAVTQAGSLALREPSNSAADSAPFITGGNDPAIVVASPPFAVGGPTVEATAPPPDERPTEAGACPGERADGHCVTRPSTGQAGRDGEDLEAPMPDRTRPLDGRYVIA